MSLGIIIISEYTEMLPLNEQIWPDAANKTP